MSVLHTLRATDTCPPSGLHPYIDTPDFAYDQWLTYLDQQGMTLGIVQDTPAVAVVGGGLSGLCAAYELARSGCNVTVFEQAAEVGGRCASVRFSDDPNDDIAEMGSMRFPPAEFILDFYLKKLGIVPDGLCSLPDFPDPGKKPTYVCYGGKVETWSGGDPPAGFKTVYKGWNAFVGEGLKTKAGAQLFWPAQAITDALVAGKTDLAAGYWQAYLDAFGQKSFYTVLYEVFTGAGGYRIPGGEPGTDGTPWTVADFDRFGALGVGSGGFGPLYPVGFVEIFRLIVNELETKQKFLTPSATLTNGIRSLPMAFEATNLMQVEKSTPITSITPGQTGFTLTDATAKPWGPYARVIVATTTRAMELSLNLTAYGPNALVSADVAKAIMRIHLVSSNKVAALIENFWSRDPDNAVRCLQTDNLAHQVYTLDYTLAGQVPPNKTGVCFISYVWDDDAVKQQAITSGRPTGAADNQSLYQYLLGTLETLGEPAASWAKTNLQPFNGDFTKYVIFEEWQSSPYFAGAFKLSEPGQDPYVQTMFYDYQKCLNSNLDTGVYIAGDCISWTSGWVEGGLTTALNAAAGVIASLSGVGALNPDAAGKTPLSVQARRYNYFSGSEQRRR